MKNKIILMSIFSASLASFAYAGHHRNSRGRTEEIFLLGVCAGQQLSHQGMATMDDVTIEALRAALQDCRSQTGPANSSQGTNPSQEPNPSQGPTPAPVVSPSPTPAPSPSPTASPAPITPAV